jgi:uncharacterized YigZ family protein
LSYHVPASEFEAEHLVKKSRFIARVMPVDDREQVKQALARTRQDYPDARHHCWAYLLGNPQDASNAGMSDDGEPAGTAGKPILNVLQHGHFGDVLVVVIRYFGGVKLGAGGLVRAYSKATQQALDLAPATELVSYQYFQLIAGFSQEQGLRHLVSNLQGQVLQVSYSECIDVAVALPASAVSSLLDYSAAHSIQVHDSEKT